MFLGTLGHHDRSGPTSKPSHLGPITGTITFKNLEEMVIYYYYYYTIIRKVWGGVWHMFGYYEPGLCW